SPMTQMTKIDARTIVAILYNAYSSNYAPIRLTNLPAMSSGCTTHSRSNGDFLVLVGYPPNGRVCLARFCLRNGVFEPSQPFRPLCPCPQNSVSRQRRLRLWGLYR